MVKRETVLQNEDHVWAKVPWYESVVIYFILILNIWNVSTFPLLIDYIYTFSGVNWIFSEVNSYFSVYTTNF